MNRNLDPKRAVPVLLVTFVFCLVVDNGFKTMTLPMAQGLGISDNTASLQASLAGVIIGIGAVVYAALADAISIRKLMLVGIGLMVAGSLLGFIFSGSWPMVLAARIIMTSGLAAAETLYVIYVTKYLDEKDQKKYLGFSTAAFQTGLLLGALTSGYIATYVSWTAMFLVPLLAILAVPFIHKQIPDHELSARNLDVFGLFTIAVFAASATMFMQNFQVLWLIPLVGGIAVFAWHVKNHKGALVAPEFFRNKRYVAAITLVFIAYSTQLGFIFLLPFMAERLHGMSPSAASNLMIPGFICAILVGVFSGAIGKKLSSRVTIFTALSMIVSALILAAVGAETHVITLVVAIVLFASAFALLYAPLVKVALTYIEPQKSGVAIGFYNLVLNIAVPLGIALAAKLQNLEITWFAPISPAATHEGTVYASVLWVLAFINIVGLVFYFMADRKHSSEERKAGITPATLV